MGNKQISNSNISNTIVDAYEIHLNKIIKYDIVKDEEEFRNRAFPICIDEIIDKYSLKKNIKQSDLDQNFLSFHNEFINGKYEKISSGILCLLHNIFTVENLKMGIKIKSNLTTVASLGRIFSESGNYEKAIYDYITYKYIYDGNNFYEYTNRWSKCLESDINCDDFATNTHCDIIVNSKTINVDLINNFMTDITDHASNFNNFSEVISDIKNNIIKVNNLSGVILCNSYMINLEKKRSERYRRSNYIVSRLSYDPIMQTTTCVGEFISAFKCNSTILATNLLLWGSNANSITILIGPKSSGKNTLSLLAKHLFQWQITFDELQQEDPDANTCFYRLNSPFPSEREIKNNHYSHLVFIYNDDDDPKIKMEYGGRKVNYFRLPNTIHKRKSNPFETILQNSSFEQLGSLLGWCLKNYDISSEQYDIESNQEPYNVREENYWYNKYD